MSDRMSVKKYLIRALGAMVDEQNETGIPCELVLVTSHGIICGMPVLSNANPYSFLAKISDIALRKYKTDYELDDNFIASENDGYIFLKGVTIRNGSNTITVPELIVFIDQIVAVSFKNVDR